VHYLVIVVDSTGIDLVHIADALVDVSLPHLHLVQGVNFIILKEFAVRLVIDHITGPPNIVGEVLVIVVANSAHLNRGGFVVQIYLMDDEALLDEVSAQKLSVVPEAVGNREDVVRVQDAAGGVSVADRPRSRGGQQEVEMLGAAKQLGKLAIFVFDRAKNVFHGRGKRLGARAFFHIDHEVGDSAIAEELLEERLDGWPPLEAVHGESNELVKVGPLSRDAGADHRRGGAQVCRHVSVGIGNRQLESVFCRFCRRFGVEELFRLGSRAVAREALLEASSSFKTYVLLDEGACKEKK
jgi:hypothetical protein